MTDKLCDDAPHADRRFIAHDLLTLCLRLCLEDSYSHSPETHAVLDRWRKAWEEAAGGMDYDQALALVPEYAARSSVPPPPSSEMRSLAQAAVDAQRNDTRTESEKIADGVKFIMGPGGDEGTRQSALNDIGGRLTDDEIVNAAATAADALDATRFQVMQHNEWHAKTIFDGDAGLIRFGRLVEKAVRSETQRSDSPECPSRKICEARHKQHLEDLESLAALRADGGSTKRTDERIVKARQMLYGWRLVDSAEYHNILRDIDELLIPSPNVNEENS